MNVNHIDKRNRKYKKETKDTNQSGTTAIRISSNLYELLREKAFYERTTIRKVSDDI